MAERMIDVNGVELCTETFGDPADPPILLVAGLGCSMLWWEDGFCGLLVDGGRFVIRYDQRDTGRSVTYLPGQPGYSGEDLLEDALRVLDAHDIEAAHIAGVSGGGGLAQELALAHADRVQSLTLMSTSPATSGDRDLPGPRPEFGEFLESASLDWADKQSVIDYLAGYDRMLAGTVRPYDDGGRRDFITRDIERTRNFCSLQNHDVVVAEDSADHGSLSSVRAPTLVIHGTADPMFPVAHGQTLAAEIPGATLTRLDGAGHGLLEADWRPVAEAILDHTG